jgi:glycerol-3-phosphate dehydrogenase (NAD(P)+)
MLKKIAIIGSGSWATALVKIFSESGSRINWLVRNEARAEFIKLYGHNPRYLSFVSLNMNFIEPTHDVKQALDAAELVIFAVPSAYLPGYLKSLDKDLLLQKKLAVSIKGFIPSTACVPNIFLRNWLNTDQHVAVIAGPCHAEEIGMGKNTYLTVSCVDVQLAKKISNSLNVPYLKVLVNSDPSGIEYAAILKNIIGIATGIAKGLNYGDNFLAVLVSNAMRETNRFLETIQPATRDLFDSAYFGDLLVTAYSDHSRNRTLGKLVGRGIHVSKALLAMQMIAEGFNASKELGTIIKKLDITLPVLNSVHRILHQHANPFHEFKLLEKQLC